MEESLHARCVNALVGRFYRAALNVPLKRYRETMLRELGGIIPFDAALWGTGDADATRFHSLTLLGLDERFSRTLEQTKDINPMFGELIDKPDKPVDIADLIPDERFYQSDIYATICKPFQIQRALGTSYRDSRSRLYTLIVLFRFDRKQRFTPDERRMQEHLIFHLMNAASLAYSVYLGHVSASEGARSAAICDQFGICYDTQPSFLNLVEEQYPGWNGGRLPFALPALDDKSPASIRGLQILAEPVGDLICVRAWKEGPMDLLTEREREIVDSVCRGLSYKEVARPLGIAPSTVSNHLYRVFDKLGVTSRTELAKLVSRARRLH